MVEVRDEEAETDNGLDARDVVEGEVVKEDVEVEDGVVNLDVGNLVDRPDHEDDDLYDVVQEVVLLDQEGDVEKCWCLR